MVQPGRKYSAGSSYRYGFNGKENDKDINEGGQDYGMRIYDSKVGRFLSIDPLTSKYPELTPFQFSSNTPIQAVDLDGLEASYVPAIPGTSGQIFDFFIWLFSDDVDEVVDGTNDLYDAAQSRITTQKDIRVYNEISRNKNSEISIEQYNAVKEAEGTIKGITGIAKVADGISSIGAKAETILTAGLSAPAFIRSGEKLAARLTIKTETKLSVNLSIKQKEVIVHSSMDERIAEGAIYIKKLEERASRLSKNPRPGLDVTPAGKDVTLKLNAARNGGTMRCVSCGNVVTKPENITKGGKVPKHRAEVNHNNPKSNGGSGTPINTDVFCNGCNSAASDKVPPIYPKKGG